MTHDEAVLALARFGAMVVSDYHKKTSGFMSADGWELDSTAVNNGIMFEDLDLTPGIAAAVDRFVSEWREARNG